MNSFKQLLLSSEVDQSFKDKPKVCNESGTSWVIGYNHMICDDYEYLQFQGGINESRADELLEEDLRSYLIVLEKEFNEMKVKQKFCELNTGCQYLLLSIFFSTGRFSQYSKLVDLCSKNQLYEALKYNNRKSLFNQELERDLQQYTNKERQFFEEHFLSDGTPKNTSEWKIQLIQATEDDFESANRLIQCRFENCKQKIIYAEFNNFQQCNYQSVNFKQFIRDQEGEKYNFISYSQEQQKWFSVGVEDQSNLIIGYSHVCTQDEEKYFQKGLTDGQVDQLFLKDYKNNKSRVKRYLRQEFPQYEFKNLHSWIQLFLIDISFRNYPFDNYKEAIQFALQENLFEAISLSDVYYHPSLNVHAHYQQRIEKLSEILQQVQHDYKFQKVKKPSIQNLNNIVGIKITDSGYDFILNDQAETKISFKDLITFLRVYYDPELDDPEFDIYFSLDSEIDENGDQGKYQKKVYSPDYLEGTEVGEVLFKSDLLLKQMSLGIQNNGNEAKKFDYGGLDIQPIYERDPEFFNRIFLKFGKINLNVVDDKLEKFHSLTIEQIKMVVDAREQVEGGEEILIEDPNNAASIFVNQFIKAYDQISQKYPVFKRLKEVLMANYLAKYMSLKNVQLNFEVIDQLFTSYLIPNYKKYECPTLQMNVEVSDGMIEISGGIEGGVQDIQKQIQQINDYLTQNKEINGHLENINENQQITEISLSHSSSIDSLESVVTTCSMNEIANLKVSSKNKSKQKCSRCSRCQRLAKENEQLKVFQEKPVCKPCQKCTQCGKSDADQLEGSNFYHSKCVKLINQSTLKKELLSLIQNKLKTIERKAGSNETLKYFLLEKFQCLRQQNYSGFIVGHHHALFNDSQTQLDPKQHKVTQKQVQQFLDKDFEQAETEVIKQFIEQGHQKIDAVSESIKLLLIFANFICKDLTPLKSQFLNPNYKTLYQDLQNLKCPNKAQHTCTWKSKIGIGLEFFDQRYNRQDGKPKESQMKKQM